MHKSTVITVLVLAIVWALNAAAEERPRMSLGDPVIPAGNPGTAKAAGDTIVLMGPEGSGAPFVGDFESGWNGWTSVDLTQPTTNHWQVSDYNQAVAGNLVAWCGDIALDSCNDSLDVVGGYGNSWHDLLGYRTAVANTGISALVTVAATLQYDSEPGFDFTYLSAKIQNSRGFTDIQPWDGQGTIAVNNSISYLPGELIDGNDIFILWRFRSDGIWSDEDCLLPTAGACQIDDITVTVSQTGEADIINTTDFQDGTFGDWFITFPEGVGNFAELWTNLEDVDPCRTNYSQQVAFIDDGIVVPGTGGADCINWCYGPSGYIVNTVGGLSGPDFHIENDIISPVMPWPNTSFDGIKFSADIYRHEPLSADSPGIFFNWSVRSADTDGSGGNGVQDLEEQPYKGNAELYYGGPDYVRIDFDITQMMNSGRDEIQVRIGVREAGWQFGFEGNNGTPAPYFDNVAVKVFPVIGPGIDPGIDDSFATLANDNFPEVDALVFSDLGSMHVRFDAAQNISPSTHMRNDPGDSLVLNIVPIRTGASLVGLPEMHYAINANPLFDAFRTTPTSGVVSGREVFGPVGRIPDRWSFDLPDTGTLFPGDVIHYYWRAADEVGGDIQWSTLPADISGFGDFSDPQAYNSRYVVRALPSIHDDGFGGYEVPGTLFWKDDADRGGEDHWYTSFRNLGMKEGVDYDTYFTNHPTSGLGNGLGGRTNGLALAEYNDLLYTSGTLGALTISNGDFQLSPGDDINALLNWMSTGGKDLFLTGDGLASDLGLNAGTTGLNFMETVMGLNYVTTDLRGFIGNQSTPLVLDIGGLSGGDDVIHNVSTWIAYGGCLNINAFDGVTPRGGAIRQAEFGDPNNNPGAYNFSAMTLNRYNTTNRIVSMPYGLMFITSDSNAKVDAPLSARARVLSDVLDYFGVAGSLVPAPVLPGKSFAASNYPNPFNPSTKISYTIKAPGHLMLKVFNVRGELVKTLVDGNVTASDFVMWDGTNNQGGHVSSGVYFYEARMGGEVQVSKMALIK